MTRAGSYERISKFRVDRDGVLAEISRGVDRQNEDNASVAEAMGLGVPERYPDEDRSASQFATKEREHWVRLLADTRAGQLTHVLVWLFDRAFRTTEDCEALLAACRAGGALIVQTAGNPTVADPHNPDDIFRLKLAGLLAEYEIAKMSMRQQRSKAANAKLGKPNGGVRTFGYEQGMTEFHPVEAAAVRVVVAKVLAGASLRSQALWLTEQGLTGVRGGAWNGANLGAYLRLPALAGKRLHRGQSYDAIWEGLVTDAQHEQLRALFGDPERRACAPGANVRKRLLGGGLIRCGHCGAAVGGGSYRVRKGPAKGELREIYRCRARAGCVQRPLELVEATVLAKAAAYLERLRPDGMLNSPASGEALADLTVQANTLQATIDRCKADYLADRIDGEMYELKTAKAQADLLGVRRQRGQLIQQHTVLDELAGRSDTLALLEALPTDRLRTVLSHLAVIYLDRGPREFDPEVVRFDWQVAA